MHGKDLNLLALTFILISAVVSSTFALDIAAAQCSSVNCPTACDWYQSNFSNNRDYNLSCNRCNARDYALSPDHDYDRSITTYSDNCPAPSCYRCNARDDVLSSGRDYDRSITPYSDNCPVPDCGRCNVRDCVTCNY
jgi:hypothetical protein